MILLSLVLVFLVAAISWFGSWHTMDEDACKVFVFIATTSTLTFVLLCMIASTMNLV